jgi:hypothetical protein
MAAKPEVTLRVVANGYDGIAYKSAFGENGYNVALFEVAAANLTYCELQEVTGIEFKFDQRANPYWIKEPPASSNSR